MQSLHQTCTGKYETTRLASRPSRLTDASHCDTQRWISNSGTLLNLHASSSAVAWALDCLLATAFGVERSAFSSSDYADPTRLTLGRRVGLSRRSFSEGGWYSECLAVSQPAHEL